MKILYIKFQKRFFIIIITTINIIVFENILIVNTRFVILCFDIFAKISLRIASFVVKTFEIANA